MNFPQKMCWKHTRKVVVDCSINSITRWPSVTLVYFYHCYSNNVDQCYWYYCFGYKYISVKIDILILKFIISYRELYSSFKQENYFNQNKTSKFFKIMVFRGKKSFVPNQCHPFSWIIRKTKNLSYRIVNDNYSLKNIILHRWW